MFKASRRKSAGTKGEGYLTVKELSTTIAFLCFYYYTKPENLAAASSETRVGLLKNMIKWISQHFH